MKRLVVCLMTAALLGGGAGGLAPPAPALSAAPAREQPAAALADRLGCFACHALYGQGGAAARPLDGVGARLSAGDLRKVLTYPRQLHPGARMPSYAYLPPEEINALVEFLQALR